MPAYISKAARSQQLAKGRKRKALGDDHHFARARLITMLLARDGDKCCLCGRPLDRKLPNESPDAVTIEHDIPVSLGGTDALENLKLAHRRCNQQRGDGAICRRKKR